VVKVDFDVGRGGDKNISKKPSGKKKHGALCVPIPRYPSVRKDFCSRARIACGLSLQAGWC
jgi:hypothetical protein